MKTHRSLESCTTVPAGVFVPEHSALAHNRYENRQLGDPVPGLTIICGNHREHVERALWFWARESRDLSQLAQHVVAFHPIVCNATVGPAISTQSCHSNVWVTPESRHSIFKKLLRGLCSGRTRIDCLSTEFNGRDSIWFYLLHYCPRSYHTKILDTQCTGEANWCVLWYSPRRAT